MQFQVFYGDYNILYGPNGVDLSAFKCTSRAIDKPLVGIVEFIMFGCMKYFRERYTAASINISNPQIQFCKRVTQYMQEKIEKAKLHRVISTGTMEHLLRSDEHRRELLVEGIRCHDPQLYFIICNM